MKKNHLTNTHLITKRITAVLLSGIMTLLIAGCAAPTSDSVQDNITLSIYKEGKQSKQKVDVERMIGPETENYFNYYYGQSTSSGKPEFGTKENQILAEGEYTSARISVRSDEPNYSTDISDRVYEYHESDYQTESRTYDLDNDERIVRRTYDYNSGTLTDSEGNTVYYLVFTDSEDHTLREIKLWNNVRDEFFVSLDLVPHGDKGNKYLNGEDAGYEMTPVERPIHGGEWATLSTDPADYIYLVDGKYYTER